MEIDVSNKVEQLKELKEMLDTGLINQAEFDKLRMEIVYSCRTIGSIGSTGRAFSVPQEPAQRMMTFRNPANGVLVTVEKWAAFWLTFLFGPIYWAYKEAWAAAGLYVAAAIVTFVVASPIIGYPLFLFGPPWFAYATIVDAYRRKGWIEVPVSK